MLKKSSAFEPEPPPFDPVEKTFSVFALLPDVAVAVAVPVPVAVAVAVALG